MSSTSLGASRVGLVMSSLSGDGYRCARISASGQRRGARRVENGIAADIIALAIMGGRPHLLVEVGGVGKRLGVAFAELRESILPGFVPMVVRFVNRQRFVYVDEDHRFKSFAEAIEALREW